MNGTGVPFCVDVRVFLCKKPMKDCTNANEQLIVCRLLKRVRAWTHRLRGLQVRLSIE
jgi:hypothetical protein